MPKRELTDAFIQSDQSVPKSGRIEWYDTRATGLCLRISSNGHKSLVFVTRYPGHTAPSRRRIARVNGNTSIKEVRKLAWDWQDQVDQGIDPVAELRDAKVAREAERKQREGSKFGIVLERFLHDHADRKINGKETRRLLTKELPAAWQHKSVAEIKSADCRAAIKAMAARGKFAQAYNYFGCLRSLFNWCIHEELITTSPMTPLKAEQVIGASRVARDRILTDDEMRAVYGAACQMGYPFGDVVRVLFLTGLRLNEACGLRWHEFDADKAVITIAKERMKGTLDRKQAHEVPLPVDGMAMQILNSIPRQKGPCIFSASRGKTPYVAFSRAKKELDRLSGVTKWRLHDIRRSARSHWSPIAGISDTVKELALSHVQPGIQGTYDRFKYRDQKRQLLTEWERILTAIVHPPATTNVVSLPRRKISLPRRKIA
jgi:integrase